MTYSEFSQDLKKIIEHLHTELKSIRTGRANPEILDMLQVEGYGVMNPIKNIASVSIADSKTIVIQPWDRALLTPIEKAIQTSNLGFNPLNDGQVIRLIVPDLTEERRRDLVKQVNVLGEQAKIAVRNARQKSIAHVESDKTLSEDFVASSKEDIQKLVISNNEEIEKIVKTKEAELLKL